MTNPKLVTGKIEAYTKKFLKIKLVYQKKGPDSYVSCLCHLILFVR